MGEKPKDTAFIKIAFPNKRKTNKMEYSYKDENHI